MRRIDRPLYFKERLWLVNLKDGVVGVASLWTPKEKIAPLMPRNVAFVGQLYAKGGIEFIIRNLWANPKISSLVICGQDLGESGAALREFFDKGTIDGKKPVFTEDIEEKYLEIFRKKVYFLDLRGQTDPKIIAGQIAKLAPHPPFSQKPHIFPRGKPPAVFPSEASLFRIEAPTIGLAWLEILKTILRFGWEIPKIFVYGGKERMVINLAAVITEENIKTPKLYSFFNFNKNRLKTYLKEFFNPDRGEQAYTYGERLFDYLGIDQLGIMVKKLREFPANKGALAVLWQPTIDNFPKRNPWRTPCLTLVQGICQEETLHLTAYFRSHDMFGAWPMNAFALRKLQTVLAEKIGKRMGVLTIISQSAFIEENDLLQTEKIIRDHDRLFCLWDPRGNLTVGVEKNDIVVRHFSPDGKLMREFRVNGKEKRAAEKITEKLLLAQAVSRVDHALDIGLQLARAEDAIKLGLKFEQDKSTTLSSP